MYEVRYINYLYAMAIALFGYAQPKSRLHTSHLNDIIHVPHQSRAASNLHQPTYRKIFCVRR